MRYPGAMAADHHKLLGSYKTPHFRYGSTATCEVRVDAVISRMSNARIPRPVGKPRGKQGYSLVVYWGLANAIRRESASAICYWWGISAQTVSKWRKEMGVGQWNEGTTRLKAESARVP